MIIKTKRFPKCPACKSSSCAWGKRESGTKRFRCLVCFKTFTTKKKQKAKQRQFLVLFEGYVLRGESLQSIASKSGYFLGYLQEKFTTILCTEPPVLDIPIPEFSWEERYMLIDGLWFGKRECVMLYRYAYYKPILRVSFLSKEYGTLIAKDLLWLKEQGYKTTCAISDGGTGIKKAILKAYGKIPHQHCLAHMYRLGTGAIGKYPKDYRIRQLKQFLDALWLIESQEALTYWKQLFRAWKKKHYLFLVERRSDGTRSWFAHPGVRKATKILASSYKNSFVFLTHPMLPKTTNHLEGSIGNVRIKLVIHRGLKREKIHSFLRWFIYFYNKNILSQKNIKKA